MIFGFLPQGQGVAWGMLIGHRFSFFTRRCVRQQPQLQSSRQQLLGLGGWPNPTPLSHLPRADEPLRRMGDPVVNTFTVDEDACRRRRYLLAPYGRRRKTDKTLEMEMTSKYFGTPWLR